MSSSDLWKMLYRSVENVIPTNIVNTVVDISVGCDVWQMKCYTYDMADGKAMYADNTT